MPNWQSLRYKVLQGVFCLLASILAPISVAAQEKSDIAVVLAICSTNGLSFEARVEAFQSSGWNAVNSDSFELATNVVGDAGISFAAPPYDPESSWIQERAGSRSHIGSQLRKPNSTYFKTAVFQSPTEPTAFVIVHYIKQGNSVRCSYGGSNRETGRVLMRELNGNTLPDIGYYARRIGGTIESNDPEDGPVSSILFFTIAERREIASVLTEPLLGTVQLIVITRNSRE